VTVSNVKTDLSFPFLRASVISRRHGDDLRRRRPADLRHGADDLRGQRRLDDLRAGGRCAYATASVSDDLHFCGSAERARRQGRNQA
jgi:hypothetical protein